jgi:hypothetical protein
MEREPYVMYMYVLSIMTTYDDIIIGTYDRLEAT